MRGVKLHCLPSLSVPVEIPAALQSCLLAVGRPWSWEVGWLPPLPLPRPRAMISQGTDNRTLVLWKHLGA